MEKLKAVRSRFTALMVVAVAAGAASLPAAAEISTTAAVSTIGDASTAIAAVGAAIIGLAALSMAYRWVKATFF